MLFDIFVLFWESWAEGGHIRPGGKKREEIEVRRRGKSTLGIPEASSITNLLKMVWGAGLE